MEKIWIWLMDPVVNVYNLLLAMAINIVYFAIQFKIMVIVHSCINIYQRVAISTPMDNYGLWNIIYIYPNNYIPLSNLMDPAVLS